MRPVGIRQKSAPAEQPGESRGGKRPNPSPDTFLCVADMLTNWAGNVTFSAREICKPASVDELRALVAGRRHIRAIGTGHSFNDIADTAHTLVSVARLPVEVELDRERSTATVSAGLRYGELATRLHASGYALGNLGSLPHISVAGACATGTHGSGQANGSLSSAVRGIEMVTADGDVVTLRRDIDEAFPGAVVALGRLGIVTKVTLDVVATFDVRQHVYDNLPADQLDEHFDEIVGAAYSVSLFTGWQGRGIDQVWLKEKIGDKIGADAVRAMPARWMGATLADGPRHPLPGMPAANCTRQLGEAGPWHERLPHFRLDFVPSSGDELQSEYLLPRENALAAIDALREVEHRIAAVLRVSEIRTVAADDLWLSPAYGRDTIAFHFTWMKDAAAVLPVLTAIEERLDPFGARPHWGKLFTTDPAALRHRYSRYADFESLVRRYDPAGKFGNAFTERLFPNTR